MGSICSTQLADPSESHNVVVNLKTRITIKSMTQMNKDPMEIFDDILIDLNQIEQIPIIEVNQKLVKDLKSNEMLQIEAQLSTMIIPSLDYEQSQFIQKSLFSSKQEVTEFKLSEIIKVIDNSDKILENNSNELFTFIPNAKNLTIEPSASLIQIDIARLAKQQFILNCFMGRDYDDERPTTPQLHPNKQDNKSKQSSRSGLTVSQSDKLIDKHMQKYQRKKLQHQRNNSPSIIQIQSKLI